MYIHEVIAKTKSPSDSIYRRAWLNTAVIEKSISIRAGGRMVKTDYADFPFSYPWNPTAEDLLADDWLIHYGVFTRDEFSTKHLGRWKL